MRRGWSAGVPACPFRRTSSAYAKITEEQTNMTEISIRGEQFYIDGRPTYAGRNWQGHRIEGLLLNSRMVQATFDDANPATRGRWAYPDTGSYDAERNVTEFLGALPTYKAHGLLAVTVNLQGGSPEGYSQEQPWDNTAFSAEGALKPDYMARMGRVIEGLDEQGMVAILGVFYFGQDERLADEAAVVRALDNTVNWVLNQGYRNVLLEVNNECDVPKYEHDILTPPRVHELIERAKRITRDGRRLLVGASYGGGTIPQPNVVAAADFLLMHANFVADPDQIAAMARAARAVRGYRPMPILFNEDDHFDFDQPWNNFVAALSEYCSWGYFDPGRNNYCDGYQSPPVQWGLSTPRKQAFFRLLREITGV